MSWDQTATVELDAKFLERLSRDDTLDSTTIDALLTRLHQSSSEWRATVDSLEELIFLVGADGRVLRTNLVLEHWNLGSVRDVEGKDVHRLLHPECADGDGCYLKSTWRTLFGTSVPVAPDPAPAEPLDDTAIDDPQLGRTIELTMRRVDPGGRRDPDRSFAVVVLRDVTDLARRRMWRRQHEQSETMTYLIRGLAHEIGNPLAAMKTSLEVLRDNFDSFSPEKRALYLARTLEGTDRIWSIVKRILHGQSWHIDSLEELVVGTICRRLEDMSSDEAVQRGLRFRVDCTTDPNALFDGDLTAVEEVLSNIVRNAFDACSDGDEVRVTTRCDDREIQFVVDDTGIGIAKDEMVKIFQPFYSTKSSGTGIGLSHVAHLMHEMHGHVDIDSELGRGTRVVVSFLRSVGRDAANVA